MYQADRAQLDSGDGFVTCSCGDRHWGLHGAAGLLLRDPTRGVLLQHRAAWTHYGGTWALPGGAARQGETPAQAATREADEEAAVPPSAVRAMATCTLDHGAWHYTTVLARPRHSVQESAISLESTELRWVPVEEVAELPLHHDFALSWPALREQLDRELVLVVDAANVVGSRPDGWWHDRARAAERLRDRLAAWAGTAVRAGDLGVAAGREWSWWPTVSLVVEGKAAGTASVEGVHVVAAERDGDSAIVRVTEQACQRSPRDHVRVVTADRELRARVRGVGADVVGPRTLLALLGDA